MTDWQPTLQRGEAYDVVVCGGGPSGIPAALAAARAGLRVLLVESQGQLGGVGVSAGVSHLLGGGTPDNREWCVEGIFREIVEELAAQGGALHPCDITFPEGRQYSPHGWTGATSTLTYGVPFNPLAMACLLDRKLLDAGVDVLLLTHLVDVTVDGDRIADVIVHHKSGLVAHAAKVVIDATGDADVAALSGCEYVLGRESDGLMTPATLIFHVDGVDTEALSNVIEQTGENRFLKYVDELRERGVWPFAESRFITVELDQPGTFMVNTLRRLDVDGTDGRSVSEALMASRQDVQTLFGIMREHFPGFADARIRMIAPNLGVRETRRIIGDFVYGLDDIVTGREFDDVIGFSGYSWDLPDPKDADVHTVGQNRGGIDWDALRRARRPITPIPYRILVPRPILNLLCPGRAVSVERFLLGPLRVQAPCYAMGETAGLAAAQAIERGVAMRDVDPEALRSSLRTAGARVDWSQAALGSPLTSQGGRD